jgi:hypothetical protein
VDVPVNVGVTIVGLLASIPPATCVKAMFVPYAVYVPLDVNVRMVLLPEVVTVGEPVLVPE